MTEDSLLLPGLSPVEGLDVHARFAGGALSSDGGVVLLRELERGLNFAAQWRPVCTTGETHHAHFMIMPA